MLALFFLAYLAPTHFAALSDAHIGQLIELLTDTLTAIKEGIKVVWMALSPVMIGYLAYRQAMNKRKLSEELKKNTDVSTNAFSEANGVNGKIAFLTQQIAEMKKEQLEKDAKANPDGAS